MGRLQEFDTDAAVDAALGVFWERGLHRTSIDDLLAASGLARSSLYNSFGSKQALFEAAVQRYVDRQVERLQKTLDCPSLKEALEKLFHGAITSNHEGRGCLLVNCSSGLMDGDSDQQLLLRSAFGRMFKVVEVRMRAAQESGQISSAIDPADAATLVCATLSGLRIFQKTGMSRSKLKKAADLAVRALVQQIE